MRRRLAHFVAISIVLAAAPAESQTIGPVLDPDNGHRYYFVVGSYTWSGAESWATSLGGHLASIGSAQENAWIQSQLPSGMDRYWIGAYDDLNTTDDVFLWLSGEPWSYHNFAAGEPDDDAGLGGQGDRLLIDRSTGGLWYDSNGNFASPGGVAEITPQVQSSPPVHDFGAVSIVAPPATASLTITNLGATRTITSLTSSAGCSEFTATSSQPLPVALANNESMVVNLTYDPTDRMADACSYTINATSGVVGFFELRGDGVAPQLEVQPTQLLFADQVWDGPTHETLNVTVTNVGDGAFALSNLGRGLMIGTQFSLGTPSGTFPVEPGNLVTIPVTFDPTSIGVKNDVLTLSLNNDLPGSPNPTVALSGTGTEAVGAEIEPSLGIRSLGPSPTAGVLRARVAFDRAGVLEVDVRDVTGRVVARSRTVESGPGARTVEFRHGSDWAPSSGLYFVAVRFGGVLLGVRKVVVAR